MLEGLNDCLTEARALVKYLKSWKVPLKLLRVNLLSYNLTSCPYRGANLRHILNFQRELKKAGITCTIRRSQGTEIQAACGQLVVDS